jgi:toxin-antitoxin system PIN domain toxin
LIAVDTNLLLYAHRAESPFHEAAGAALVRAAASRWALPWPCVHEFLAIATHPRIFDPPTPLDDALRAVEGWLAAPTVMLLSESAGYASVLDQVLRSAKVTGPRVHDARVYALCLHHGVRELWSADRDFSRFSGVAVKNPLAP